MAEKKVTRVKKKKKSVPISGIVFVNSTFNNTIITITDEQGKTLSWSSGGNIGFKGSRKGTAYAAQLAAEKAGKEVLSLGMKKLKIFVKGPGAGREAAVRTFQALGFEIEHIKDLTSIPHNGCRPRKRRRV
ncbi:MAG TPA: 30S ribosomal protein S11 [bacterium]|nr:30S ribosomal protein S11 [bacterium]HPQ20124.1 30S ribosomal protein S11 [bacterium]